MPQDSVTDEPIAMDGPPDIWFGEDFTSTPTPQEIICISEHEIRNCFLVGVLIALVMHDAGFPSPASSDLIDNQIMEQLKLAATIDLSAILADENISPGIKAILQQQHAANCALFKFLTMQQQTEDPAEKKERERSVVIIGIKESPSDVPSERHKNDVAMVTGLFDQLGIEPTPVVYRLGRQSDPARKGPRLIKAILPAKFFQFMVLGAWKRCRTDIRKQHGYENMLIRPSLTLEQRMKEREERKFRDKTPDKKKLFPRTSSLLSG